MNITYFYATKLLWPLLLLSSIHFADNFIVAWKRGIAIISAGTVKVTPDPRIRLANGYSLEIRDAVPQDAGDYICQIATLEPREITHTVEILGKFSIYFPWINDLNWKFSTQYTRRWTFISSNCQLCSEWIFSTMMILPPKITICHHIFSNFMRYDASCNVQIHANSTPGPRTNEHKFNSFFHTRELFHVLEGISCFLNDER